MNNPRETFNKSERLCSRKLIESMFEDGNVFCNSLFKIVWGKNKAILPCPAQVAFSVSKKGFRLAVTRNLIKRRMREAYRRNKKTLYDHLLAEKIQLAFVVIMRGNQVPDYVTIERAIKETIKKLIVLTSQRPEDRFQK